MFSALEYEVERQRRVVEDGGRVVQETRGWQEDRAVTFSQRSKEHAHDYRYFPEPDLPELLPDPAWVEEIRASLPELPAQRRDRFVSQYGLPLYDAGLLTANRSSAEFFEEAINGNVRRLPTQGQARQQLDARRSLPPSRRRPRLHRRIPPETRPPRPAFGHGGIRRPKQLPRQDRPPEGLPDGQDAKAHRRRRGLRADKRLLRG